MSDYVCILVTLLCGDELLKVALKFHHSKLTVDERDYPLETAVRAKIFAMLPINVRTFAGPIVAVETIFEVCEAK